MISEEKNVKTTKTPLWISLSLLIVLVAGYFFVPSFQNAINEAFEVLTSDDKERISKWVGQFGIAGPIVLVLAMVAQMFLFVVPNVLMMIIAIVSYGPVWGSVIALTGIFASSSIGYMIGRYLGPGTLNKLISIRTQERIGAFIKDYGVPAVAITRLSSLSNDSLSIVAGLLKMRYLRYISATMGGITPLIVLLAVYGQKGKIEKALIWIAGVSFILLILYIFLDKRKKRRRSMKKT